MKKIFKYLSAFCLLITLSACSSTSNGEYALEFFNALDNTLDINSGHIEGEFNSAGSDSSKMIFDLQLNQEKTLNLAFDLDLEAGQNSEDNFLSFFIKDGKTYLNSYGTTSQSVVENIGLEADQKLSVSNPFLSYTDDELKAMFSKASKKDDTYTFTLDSTEIGAILDSMGSVQIEDAVIEAKIEDDYITFLSVQITGYQNLDSQQATIDINLTCTIDQINQLNQVSFPSDLESY